MRRMMNVRTGKFAAYEEELVATGKWVEVEEPKPVVTEPKGFRLPKIKAKGALDVAPQADKE